MNFNHTCKVPFVCRIQYSQFPYLEWGHRGFPHSSVGKESACNAGDPGLIPGLGGSTGEGIGYPLQCSWVFLVAQLVKNLSGCGRPRFDHWFGKIPWRRERLPNPVFWPGEFHGLYSPWGCKELDMTERLLLSLSPLLNQLLDGKNYFFFLFLSSVSCIMTHG